MNRTTVRVWDLPTRLFHGLLIAGVVGLVITGQIGGNAMEWHFRLGYAVLTLLLFRLVWGFAGGRWSRFTSFVRPPGVIWRYLRGSETSPPSVGHNPLGAVSVLVLLGVLLLQVGTGLFSDDEILSAGPLSRFLPSAWVGSVTFYHKEIGKLLLILLVVLHVAAILYYRLRRGQDLVRAMITGDKEVDGDAPPSLDHAGTRWRAAFILALCAGLVAAMLRFAA
ncbi:MAG: cytochrome b [Rhodoferax sp.]|nr:cytochrome b [Rhodoferax sp.]